jgi:hypothetical protein
MEQLFLEFREITRSTKIIYVQLPGSDRVQPTQLARIDVGGSKIAYSMDIDDTLALLVGNTDVENPCLYWPKMVDSEVAVSSSLQEAGLITANNRKTTIYLDVEQTKAIPAYFSDKFSHLATQNKFVLDAKNYKSTPWKGGIFASEEEMMTNIEKWRQILQPFMEDIDRLYQVSAPRYGDSINYIVIRNEDGYSIRYFGFDFAGKSGACLECTPQKLDPSLSGYQSFKYEHLRHAIEYCIFQEYEGWNNPKFGLNSQQITSILEPIYPKPSGYDDSCNIC